MLLSCGPSVEELAVVACEGVPGLSMDAAGRALLTDVVPADVLETWRTSEPRAGLAELGPIQYGVVRANVSCRVASSEGGTVELVRTEPALVWPFDKEEVEDLPTREVSLALEVADTAEGRRVLIELDRAVAEADAAAAAPPDEALAKLDALEAWFPDPMIRWERRLVEERALLPTVADAVELDVETGVVRLGYAGPELEQLEITVSCPEASEALDVPNVATGAELVLLAPMEVGEGCSAEVTRVVLPR